MAIVAAGSEIARTDAAGLFQFCAIVNINLAAVNLLPLPALDGAPPPCLPSTTLPCILIPCLLPCPPWTARPPPPQPTAQSTPSPILTSPLAPRGRPAHPGCRHCARFTACLPALALD